MFNQYQSNFYGQPGLLPQTSLPSAQGSILPHQQYGGQPALLPSQQQKHMPQPLINPQIHHHLTHPNLNLHAGSLLGVPPGMNMRGGAPLPLTAVQQGALGRAALMQAVAASKNKPFNRSALVYSNKKVTVPLKPEEVLNKLEKLVLQFDDPNKFVSTANDFIAILNTGVSKANATKFFEVLQKLSPFIGSPEYNSVVVFRIFDSANNKKAVFSAEEGESLAKWRAEADDKRPKPSVPVFGKRPADSDAQADANKRPRHEENVESILLKRIDSLEVEVSKLRSELTKTKQRHDKELLHIRLHFNLPAPMEDEEATESIVAPQEPVAAPQENVVPQANALENASQENTQETTATTTPADVEMVEKKGDAETAPAEADAVLDGLIVAEHTPNGDAPAATTEGATEGTTEGAADDVDLNA